MSSIFFFVPKLQIFKSLNKISIYDILTNKFNVKLSEKLKPEYCIPIKELFEEMNFYYEISNDQANTIHRNHYWFDIWILLIQLINIFRSLIYIFWDNNDQFIRLYAGDIIQFFGSNTVYITIPQAGLSLYALAIFCLFQYSPIEQMKWLIMLNAIEGKDSFINSNLFTTKSANRLIKLSLIVTIYCTTLIFFTPFFVFFNFMFFSSLKLNLNQILMYVLPWAIVDTIWVHHMVSYGFISLIVLIICYYYELRLYQLDMYTKWYLKINQFNKINQQINKLLVEYDSLIEEVHQLNKFVSKVIFYVGMFCSSTVVFLIYNMIYYKMDPIMLTFYLVFSSNVAVIITAFIIRTFRFASQFRKNKSNLIALCYIENIQIQTRFKVK